MPGQAVQEFTASEIGGLTTAVHPPGSIIFAGGEFLRYSGFMFSLLAMQKPDETQVLMKQSVSVVDNLNHCIRNMRGDWVHIQSDDQLWEEDALIRLLDWEVDVVVPLILMRAPPYAPVIYKELGPDGYLPFELGELPAEGLIEVFAAGSGGMTIRKHVLDAIGDPWFEYDGGQHLNEDLVLCRKIREAGFNIYCDVSVGMGHRASHTIWPIRDDDSGWCIGFNLGPTQDGKANSVIVRPNQVSKED